MPSRVWITQTVTWMMATAVDPSDLLGKKTRLGDFKTHTNLDAATCSVFPRSCCWAVEGSRCTGNVFFSADFRERALMLVICKSSR